MVVTYIPEKEFYESNLPNLSEFDKFNQNKIKDLKSLSENFNKIRYEFIPNSAYFFVIRDEEVAAKLNIGKNGSLNLVLFKLILYFTY